MEPFAELAAALALDSKQDGFDEISRTIGLAHSQALRRGLQGSTQTTPILASTEFLRAGLKPHELLLNFLIGEDHGTVLAVSHDKALARPLPGWTDLRSKINRYRMALKRPLSSAEARMDPEGDLRRAIDSGKALRQDLLGPVEELITQANRIYIVPDQDLALLPFAALPAQKSGSKTIPGPLRFLGETVEIAMLPLAGQELSRLQRVWQGDDVTMLCGPDLSSDTLNQLALDEFHMLHFATHAVASSLDPRRCAVILSGDQRLGMQQISEMHLGPSLVVLSACRTGEGEVIPGEGVVGLSWAFLKAGAHAIAASLWSVEDNSTADLMVVYHRHLKSGQDPVSALSLAQRELAVSHPHPAYWAPFVVILSPLTTD